ncbi:MAG: CHAT domain-containing protein [Oscillatoriales cyanobacterium C42_A2020_001]|nr:CHAT domain-containing protein [Leptolyngbyaceae cyanobacterium C42_A2020_001]
MSNRLNLRIGRSLRRLALWGLLGVLLAWGLPMLPGVAQQPDTMGSNRAQALNLQGQQQLEQGDPQGALESWLQAETLYRQAGKQAEKVEFQLNQARALQALGFYRRAKTLLEQVVAEQQPAPNSALKANSLLALGNGLRLVGEYERSQEVLTASLAIAQQINSSPDIQAAYLHLGNALLAQQEFPTALDYFNKAAALEGTLQLTARLRQFKLLQQLERSPAAMTLLPEIESQLETLPISQQGIYGRIELAAILMHGTKPKAESAVTIPPISASQTSLKSAQLLAIAMQQAKALGDRRAESYATGRLAQLYEQTQQWAEAERLTQRALQLAKSVNVPEIIYQWQWQMGRILQSRQDTPGATAAYTQAVGTLQSLRKDLVAIGQDVQFTFRDQVEPVYRGLVDLLLQPTPSQENLKKARQVIESLQLAELNNFFREACLDAEAKSIDEVDPTAAVIYPVILPDRLDVILTLPGQPLRHYSTRLTQTEIEAGIQRMRSSLRRTSFTQERLAAAQQMYRWLIQPAVAELQAHQIKTLVFVPDGSLRSLPIAALHDGDRYLLEQYQIAIAPSLQLLSPRPLQREQMRALVGGLSEGIAGSAPLPGVEREINQISQQISARVLLNRSFTTASLQSQVQTAPFTVVHLATHGQFSSEVDDTYVQTWDGRLTVNELQGLLNQRSLTDSTAIELLVLSACQTAEGDNRAALGMAGVAVRSGARSTLATLWAVNDDSTAAFIAAFYKALSQPNISKAQAVQEAQLSLLRSPEFKHPFYWAPFILVGNWL